MEKKKETESSVARCPHCKRVYRRGNIMAHTLHFNKACVRKVKQNG